MIVPFLLILLIIFPFFLLFLSIYHYFCQFMTIFDFKITARASPSIEDVPLRTFTGNGGTVYCYGENGLWRKTNIDDWNTISGIIKKSLMEQLKQWTDANERRLGDDSFSLRYHTYVQKIMCCIPKIQPKFTALLSQRVKVSLNSVTTFEFKLS